MNEQLHHFLKDLITLVQDEYRHSVQLSEEASGKEDSAYYDGSSLAYWHVLELIQVQLAAFDYDSETLGEILPTLGKTLLGEHEVSMTNSNESDK